VVVVARVARHQVLVDAALLLPEAAVPGGSRAVGLAALEAAWLVRAPGAVWRGGAPSGTASPHGSAE
jgi:hypothetical protein